MDFRTAIQANPKKLKSYPLRSSGHLATLTFAGNST